MLSTIGDFDRATSWLLSRRQNESSCEAIHTKMCFAHRFISCKSNRLCEWTRFETEAQSSLVMAYCAASASFLRITPAHVRDVMARAGANGLGTITNHEPSNGHLKPPQATLACFSSSCSQGWRSGESTRLPPMWPGFDSRTRRHKRVEFVLVLFSASRVFLRVLRFSSLTKNQHTADSISL